jgi:hypothetical protein
MARLLHSFYRLLMRQIVAITALGLTLLPTPMPFLGNGEASGFFFRRSRPCGLFRPCRPLFARPNRLINRGGGRFQRANGFVNFGNTEPLQGFARIRTAGRNIVGTFNSLVNGEPVFRAFSLFIDGAGMLRDGGGRDLARFDRDLVKDVREFYFQNLDSFKGRARNAVLRFLGRNAGNTGIFGQLKAQVRDQPGLSAGVVPTKPEYAGLGKDEIRKAALAFVMNTLSNSCTPLNFSLGEVGVDGTLSKNLNGFIENTRLATLLNENPYACGDSRAPVRVDWLVTRAMTPEVYNPVAGFSDNFKTFANQIGVRSDQRNERDFNGRKIDRILVKGPRDFKETSVGVNPQRVLEVQGRAGSQGSFYRSYDFIEYPTSGQNTVNRDVLSRGIEFASDASEMIFTKCNNFLGFYLADAKGNRARAAPAEIAIDGSKSVVSPDSCLKCHANGFLGGGLQKFGRGPEPYSDYFSDIRNIDRDGFHARFFSTNPEYLERQKKDSALFNAAKVATGAHLPYSKEAIAADPFQAGMSLPVLHDMPEEYRKPPTLAQVAAEVGAVDTPAFRADVLARLKPKPSPRPPGTIDREDLEGLYCYLRSTYGARGAETFQPGTGHTGGGIGSGIQRRTY